MPLVKLVSPNVDSRIQIVYGNKNWNTSISGTGARYPEVRLEMVCSDRVVDLVEESFDVAIIDVR